MPEKQNLRYGTTSKKEEAEPNHISGGNKGLFPRPIYIIGEDENSGTGKG
jgi:hypothetical protein